MKTQAELKAHYRDVIIPMVAKYNYDHGTDVKPWECVKHDPYCGGCEMAQEDYKELEKVVDELSLLVRRLAHRLKKIDNNNELSAQAMDYLARNNLTGSLLRQKELQGENNG